jgi:hypothetical protein
MVTTMEQLEQRTLLSGTGMDLGEAEPFQLQHNDIRETYATNHFVSDGNGLVVRALGGDADGVWRIALYQHIGESSGAGVERAVDLPGARANTSVNMAVNDKGQLVISWRITKPNLSAENLIRIYQIGTNLSLTPVTGALSVATARYYTDMYHPAEVGIDNAGNVTAAWSQLSGNTHDVMGRRYLKSNNYKGEKSFTAHAQKQGTQNQAKISVDQQSGSVFIGWRHFNSNSGPNPYMVQKFDSGGRRVGGEVKIVDHHNSVQLASNPADGGFVARWLNYERDVSFTGTFQYFSAAVSSQGPAVIFSHHPIGVQSEQTPVEGGMYVTGTETFADGASIAVDSDGNLVAFYSRWDNTFEGIIGDDGSETGWSVVQTNLFARHYLRSTGTLSEAFHVASGEYTRHVSSGPNWSNYVETYDGTAVVAGNAVAVGADQFMLPFREATELDSLGVWPGTWYAHTLAPGSGSASSGSSLFSNASLAGDSGLTSLLQDQEAVFA